MPLHHNVLYLKFHLLCKSILFIEKNKKVDNDSVGVTREQEAPMELERFRVTVFYKREAPPKLPGISALEVGVPWQFCATYLSFSKHSIEYY